MKRLTLTLLFVAATLAASAQTLLLDDIRFRDPYILADQKSQTYYLYLSSTTKSASGKVVGGVKAYTSKDLIHWNEPVQVFTCPDDNWITGNVWAPEVHQYKGKYYLFATLNTDLTWKGGKNNSAPYTFRGTQIFWSKSPLGPFKAFSTDPHTPIDQMALDGTLWVEDGTPYIVYCHEWVQIDDGAIEMRPLKKDLSAPTAPPTRLFCASAADWVDKRRTIVTDGCFLYRTKTGKLLMTWSSWSNGKYSIGIAESTTGRLSGPWKHQAEPLFDDNAGHCMIFRSFDGKLRVVFHCPNDPAGKERAKICELEDLGETIRIKQ